MIQVRVKFDQLRCRFLTREDTDAVNRMMIKPARPMSWRMMKSKNKLLYSFSTAKSTSDTAEEDSSNPKVQANEFEETRNKILHLRKV